MTHTCVKSAFYVFFFYNLIMKSKHCVRKYSMLMEVDLRLLCTSLVVAAIIYKEINDYKRLEFLQTLLQLHNIRKIKMHTDCTSSVYYRPKTMEDMLDLSKHLNRQ